jgi:hypothetical protein
MSSYPPIPQRKACNCSDPCISTDDVYYAGPNLPNSGINTYNVLTEVIEKLDAIYAVPTLQRVTEMGNYTTLPIIADSFVKIGGDGNNVLLDNGTTISLSSIGGNQNLQQVTNLGNTIVLPSNASRAIDITLPDLLGPNSKGIFVTIEPQTGTYPNPDAYVARIKGQNPGSLANFIAGFYSVATGADNYSFCSEHNIGALTSTHYFANNQNGVTSDFANFYTNFVSLFKIDYLGNVTAAKFIKEGGTSSQFLMADGSVSTAVPFVPGDYDLDEFTNTGIDPFAHVSDIPAPLGYTPVNKAGDTMLGDLILNEDPSTALGAATKQYVDNIVAGINFHAPVTVATDVSLVATYDNGVDGLGATLTGTSVGVLIIDGETPTYLQRILVWQQIDAIENGVYDLTTVGDGTTIYQLTRSTDADNSPVGEIQYGDYVLVLSGDTNGGFGFICNTPGTIDIGITPINYVQFNAAQAITAGYGLQELTPNVISINPLETQEKITLTTTGSGAATLDDLTNTLNIPTIGVVSATETGVVNNTSLQELGGVDKTINGVRVGRGNISDPVSENTAVGYQALKSVVHTTGTTGYYNTAFGDSALTALISGEYNSAFGDWALIECTTGKYNVAIGTSALRKNNAEYNTGVGVYALGFNKGSFNTAIGFSAGGFNTTPSTGSWNILVGMQAGRDISTGGNNLLIENITNASITSGSFNIVLNPKQKSGVTTGSFNTIIGCWDGAFPNAMVNNVIIGDGQGNIRFRTTETGLTTVPGQTNALIDADTTGKAVVTKEYVNNRLVLEKSGNYTLVDADSGGIVIFTASATLTIPTGLAAGFECTFVTLAGVTLTVVSTGNTLNNATSTTMLPQLSFTLKRMLAANTYITAGSL